MTEPGVYAAELYQQVLPLHGPDPDGLARDLVSAWTHGAWEIDDLARDDAEGRAGWGVILDVDEAPAKGLYWLSQIAGVKIRTPKITTVSSMIGAGDTASFEAGTGSWQTTGSPPVAGGVLTRDTVNPARGTGSGKLVAAGANQGVRISFGLSMRATDYLLGIDLRGESGGQNLLIQFRPLTVTSGSFQFNVTVSEAWERYYFTVPIDRNRVYRMSIQSGIGTFWFDGVTLIDAAYADRSPGYFLGSFSYAETEAEWDAYARDAIRRQGGKARGTPDAILSAVEDTLTGGRDARLLERVGGNAYALELITRPSQTPDAAATLAAALTQKPAGMTLTHTQTEGALIDEGVRTIDSTAVDIDAATISDIV